MSREFEIIKKQKIVCDFCGKYNYTEEVNNLWITNYEGKDFCSITCKEKWENKNPKLFSLNDGVV